MKNKFLEKSCKNCGRETICRLFSKKLKLSVSLDLSSKHEGYQKLSKTLRAIKLLATNLTKLQNTYFTSYNTFLENKKGYETSLSVSF